MINQQGNTDAVAVSSLNMIGDNKEYRILGKSYGACCPFDAQFFKGNKPFQFISFLFNISLYPFSCGPSATWIFCRKNEDRYMSRKGERTQCITTFSFHIYLFLWYISPQEHSQGENNIRATENVQQCTACFLSSLIQDRQHLNVKQSSISLQKKMEIQDEQCGICFNDLSVKFSAPQGATA